MFKIALKISLLTLIFALVISCFGCSNNSKNQSHKAESGVNSQNTSSSVNDVSINSNNQNGSQVSSNTPVSAFNINGNSITKFKIVRQHYNGSYLTFLEIENLCGEILMSTGHKIEVAEDMYTDESDYEIVIGECNRNEVENIVNYDEYHVTIKGNKVYLNGGSPYATTVAVTEFCNLLKSKPLTDNDSIVGSYSVSIDNYDSAEYYRYVWGDDFDGDAVDTTKWDVITEEHYGVGKDGLSGQNGKQCLRVPEANVVKNGCLYQMQYFDDKAYYGGTIRSNNHMKFMGGYLEHSVITPDNPTSWNTCWMSAVEDNSIIVPEIDLNENFGKANVTDANAHVWPKSGAAEYGWVHRSFDQIRTEESKYRLPIKDREEHNLNTEFHTFGFLWREDYIAFIGDGKIYCDLNLDEKGFEDYKLAFTTVAVKLIIAASPGVGSGPKDTSSPEHWESDKSDYVTDYIHLYQLKDGWSRLVCDY